MELFKACLARDVLSMKRNKFVYIFKVIQLILMALIASTLFLRTKLHKDTVNDGIVYMGVLFFSLVHLLFNGYAELSLTIMKLPVFYKQRDLRFFPAWALCCTLMGYDPIVSRFFRQFLVLFFLHQMASGLFRFNAALGRNMIVASTFGTGGLVTLLVLGGFILSRDDVKKWWIWGYWISPLMYAQNAISVNEFLGHSWNKVIDSSGVPLGVQVLESRGIFQEARWYWIGVGGLLGFILLFNLCFSVGLTISTHLGSLRLY